MMRDELALERTRLANERTLLAYCRTALGMLAAAAALLQFFDSQPSVTGSAWLLIVAGVVSLIIGVVRYAKVRAYLKRVPEQWSSGPG